MIKNFDNNKIKSILFYNRIAMNSSLKNEFTNNVREKSNIRFNVASCEAIEEQKCALQVHSSFKNLCSMRKNLLSEEYGNSVDNEDKVHLIEAQNNNLSFRVHQPSLHPSKGTTPSHSTSTIPRKAVLCSTAVIPNLLSLDGNTERLLSKFCPQISQDQYNEYHPFLLPPHTLLQTTSHYYIILAGELCSLSEQGTVLYTHRQGAIFLCNTGHTRNNSNEHHTDNHTLNNNHCLNSNNNLNNYADKDTYSATTKEINQFKNTTQGNNKQNNRYTFEEGLNVNKCEQGNENKIHANTSADQTIIKNTQRMIPRNNPFALSSGSEAVLCVRFTEETYNRSLKKSHQKEIQQHTHIIQSMFGEQMKKYLGYFVLQTYRYNEYIPHRMFVVVSGEVELKTLVKACKGDLVQFYNEQNHRNSQSVDNYSKAVSEEVKVLAIDIQVYHSIVQEYPNVVQRILNYRSQVSLNRATILKKNIRIMKRFNMINKKQSNNLLLHKNSLDTCNHHSNCICKTNHLSFNFNKDSSIINYNKQIISNRNNEDVNTKKDKKHKTAKKRRRRNKKQSLEWWGLAQKQAPVHKIVQFNKKFNKQPLPKGSIPDKITQFKKKLFEQELEAIEQQNIQLNSPFKVEYVPKLQKLKLKVCEIKPKIITNKEKIKKILVNYAKSKQVFVDQLQLV